MKLAIAQINCVVGDMAGNAQKILAFAERAKVAGAALMVTPELALCGYPPEDLLLRAAFNRACEEALSRLAGAVHGICVVVGHPQVMDGKLYNAASVLRDGAVAATYRKSKLPNYEVFDEERYFESAVEPCVFEAGGARFGINICADVWEEGAASLAQEAGAKLLLVLNASPYHVNKQRLRYEIVRGRVRETGLAVVYANLVGGQDELVFDGASFAVDAAGNLTHQLPEFSEHLGLITIEDGALAKGEIAEERPVEASVYDALCLGVKDYIGKNSFPGALIGLSGGVDSALTLAIAVDALGATRVHAVMMPSQFTSEMSREDARAMARNLGVRYSEISIQPVFEALLAGLAPEFNGLAPDATEENLQARARGTLMMALSNKYGAIVLTTGNKSEMSVGYATLYGDMAGGFAVIKDISKTLVYRLARYRNGLGAVIPQRVIDRPPSAELKPNQTDQDVLPPYDVLDAIMEAYVEQDLSPEQIVAGGFRPEDVERVTHMIKVNEYKRRQSPVGIRITSRGFGKDWRYPITSKFK